MCSIHKNLNAFFLDHNKNPLNTNTNQLHTFLNSLNRSHNLVFFRYYFLRVNGQMPFTQICAVAIFHFIFLRWQLTKYSLCGWLDHREILSNTNMTTDHSTSKLWPVRLTQIFFSKYLSFKFCCFKGILLWTKFRTWDPAMVA